MSTDSFLGKSLRFIGILLMGLTAGFTLLGGVGTSCAALAPTNYDSMKGLAPFQWLYILFVLVGVALGIWGIRATILLVRGAKNSYREALIILIAGVLVGFTHIAASRAYYAAFYAASALLLKNGTDTNKHSGVIALIHQLFVKTGRLDKEHGKNLNWLFELRGIGDYGMSEHVSAGEAYKSIKVAEDFLKAALKILEE